MTITTVNARINGLDVEVPVGTSILDAARSVQIKIPTLCKHPDLLPTSACGLCIVKIAGSNKMPRACATAVEEGMDITTHDPELTAVRCSTLELIISNHPNACLTCGRNGSCELQTLAGEFGIRQDCIPRYVRELEPDCSTGSIIIDFTKCIKCGRCIQVCQQQQDVWALSFLERGINTRMAPAGDILLAESPCVRCGQCSAHCPTGAIVENDEVPAVWKALRDPAKYCTVQIAPSVRVALGEAFGYPPGTDLTRKIYSAMRRLGFKAVFDTNFSADLTIIEEAAEFVQRFTTGGELPLITSCCPAWVDFMEKRFSDFVPNFSTAKSPQQMLGVLAKTYFAEKSSLDPASIYQVSVMPCTAKKYEIERTEEMHASGHADVDLVITTRELVRLIKQSGIMLDELPDGEADSILGTYSGAGLIFGATGGVMEAALRTAYHGITGRNLEHDAINIAAVRGMDGIRSATINIEGTEVRVAVAHGLGNVDRLMQEVRKARETGEPTPYHFIEVMACPGGCIGGGGQPYNVTDQLRAIRTKGLFDCDDGMKLRFSHENPEIKKVYDEFLGEPLGEKAHSLLHAHYAPRAAYKR
ncbi:MAG: iron hydrogenase small subunit [Akkermansiaceae bacterium]|nr:iron hydrogenase small subunit [Akkermansiaceae bacterium]